MTQNQLQPPSCSFVDEAVANNREMVVQFAISMAQAAFTTHAVSVDVSNYSNCL